MKIYFLGSVVNESEADKILSQSKTKPSVAPVYFQNNALCGLSEAGNELDIHSMPPVKAYPSGCYAAWGRKRQPLACGADALWLPVINIQGAKQLSASVSTYFSVLHWLIKNRKDKNKILLFYSIYAPCASPALRLAKRHGCKTCAVITDLEDYVYKTDGASGIKSALLSRMAKNAVRLREAFDGYVFLTRHMVELYHAEQKPHIIMEGFCNKSTFENIPDVPADGKADAVMYCGALSKGFCIDKLCRAFMKTGLQSELWLYGSGECEGYIRECAEKDPRIRFFGRVERRELLSAQKKARLLINVKPTDEAHTLYAFPSKILEYMSSGTPVLTTKNGGIPDEYFSYTYTLSDESEDGIAEAVASVMSVPAPELSAKGLAARDFVLTNKNEAVQGRRISELLTKISNRSE